MNARHIRHLIDAAHDPVQDKLEPEIRNQHRVTAPSTLLAASFLAASGALLASAAAPGQGWSPSGRQLPHDPIERRLPLETDARPVGKRDGAVLDPGVVGETAAGTEHAGIGFRAAEAKAAGNGKRHLIASMREQRRALPALS